MLRINIQSSLVIVQNLILLNISTQLFFFFVFCCVFFFLPNVPNSINAIFKPFSIFQHLFALDQRDALIKNVMEAAAAFVGVSVKQRKDPITMEKFANHRLGKYRYIFIIYENKHVLVSSFRIAFLLYERKYT